MPSVLQLLLFMFPFPKLRGRRNSCRYSDVTYVEAFKSVKQSEDPRTARNWMPRCLQPVGCKWVLAESRTDLYRVTYLFS